MIIKLKCQLVEPLLWEYSASHLNRDDTMRVETHLKNCPECTRQIATYSLVQGGLNVEKNRVVPQSTLDFQNLTQRLSQRTSRKSPFALPRLRTAYMLVGAFGCALGWFLFQNHSPAKIAVYSKPNQQIAGTTRVEIESSNQSLVKSDVKLNSSPATDIAVSKSENRHQSAPFWTDPGKLVSDSDSVQAPSVRKSRNSSLKKSELRKVRLASVRSRQAQFSLASNPIRSASNPPKRATKPLNNFRQVAQEAESNYVLSGVSYTTDEQSAPDYVIGTVATNVQKLTNASYVDETETSEGL